MKNQLTLIVAAKWQQCMNSRQIEEMLKLTDDQIEFVGPIESGFGHKELTEWIERSGIILTTLNSNVKEEKLLLKHQARWKGNDGCLMEERFYYTYILMKNGKVVYLGFFENLHDAEVESEISLMK
ncbi:hypothetical protein ACFPYN_15880 [Paenisporosarcina macmurdoensis]|uniref:Nuclear transport factor 2 family protein n=1 Tax=Paenisporosarcina macmurdoensis TaxID=212659 RepID=A0ABW1LCI0_9BACL